jgi:hypothetical protein
MQKAGSVSTGVSTCSFRAKSSNTYKVVLPDNPGGTTGNASAGLATRQGNHPRQLQFGVKVLSDSFCNQKIRGSGYPATPFCSMLIGRSSIQFRGAM